MALSTARIIQMVMFNGMDLLVLRSDGTIQTAKLIYQNVDVNDYKIVPITSWETIGQ